MTGDDEPGVGRVGADAAEPSARFAPTTMPTATETATASSPATTTRPSSRRRAIGLRAGLGAGWGTGFSGGRGKRREGGAASWGAATRRVILPIRASDARAGRAEADAAATRHPPPETTNGPRIAPGPVRVARTALARRPAGDQL
ncbi:hypothetical protein EDM22_17490 [Agromyces tardus]|uniref:Uncharacterized protein n=1 Tax=Agromyces tardus TaxID=2583849 RepID=A0A3M8A048_9MICO|nr:hypothetical protein EDM22_17490 [Agromyces tardus]